MNCIKKIAYVCALSCMATGAAWGMDIFQAARTGNIERIKELLANGADINLQAIDGTTALHVAACEGHADVVSVLIEAGADIRLQNEDGSTALHGAVRCYGRTGAARCGHKAVVRKLIEAGADINQMDGCRRTALDGVIASDKHAMITLFNDSIQRIEQARQRVPMIAHTLALATHSRLGAASPLALLPQDLLRYITRLVARAEEVDYNQRIEQASQRVPVIAHTLALARHPRLGAASPLALLPQDLLRYITHSVARAEEVDAHGPRQAV